jgi:uncharacterized protein with ParB-like and HNH nuclease domain
MYYVKNKDDKYELLDGQQRTLSICNFIKGHFSITLDRDETPFYFHSLTEGEQENILNYELLVYIYEGTDREKLDWFKVINIAGEKLTTQELRNAVYSGSWVSDAKRYFSKNKPKYLLK